MTLRSRITNLIYRQTKTSRKDSKYAFYIKLKPQHNNHNHKFTSKCHRKRKYLYATDASGGKKSQLIYTGISKKYLNKQFCFTMSYSLFSYWISHSGLFFRWNTNRSYFWNLSYMATESKDNEQQKSNPNRQYDVIQEQQF